MASLLSNITNSFYLLLGLWSLIIGQAGSAGETDLFTLHFQGGLCSSYINAGLLVRNVVQCASHASIRGATAFSFCPSESENCFVSPPTYPHGAWNTSQPQCSLFSTLVPRPSIVPQPNGTKRFVLSGKKATQGDVEYLEAQNYCTSEGYQFAVISSAAEAQLLNDQLGSEIRATCTYYCFAWVYLLPTLHWHDGSLFNQCEVTISNPSDPADCFIVNWEGVNVLKMSCKIDTLPVVCQVFK
ncbi:C-type lectin-like [Trinorchestia longiramus]|nr:C-type lectin-like [Trinorchestia longiramus]